MNLKCRVMVERELEEEVKEMGPNARREIAAKFRKWAHQLEFSALIMEVDAAPKPKPRLRWMPPHKLKRN